MFGVLGSIYGGVDYQITQRGLIGLMAEGSFSGVNGSVSASLRGAFAQVVGVQTWASDIEPIEGAAGAERCAEIKAGPLGTEILGGNGDRRRLCSNRTRHGSHDSHRTQEWASSFMLNGKPH